MRSNDGNRILGTAPVAALLAGVILAACGGGVAGATGPPSAGSSASPAATAAQRPTAAPSTSSGSLAPSTSLAPDPLAGTWTTGTVTCAQWNAAIARVYKPAEIAKYDGDPNTHQCPMSFTLRFAGQHMLIFVGDELGWDGPYRITGPDTFESGDVCDYCWSYRFKVDGDRLTVDLVKDGDPVDPILDGIVQTGIFESVSYTRGR
jgi:hypothetical protein